MFYRLGKKLKNNQQKARWGRGWGRGKREVATKGKECHHQHFGKLHPTIEDRQFQAMHFLRELRDNIKRISHSCLIFATSVDGLAY